MIKIGLVGGVAWAEAVYSRSSHRVIGKDSRLGLQGMNSMFGLDELTGLCQLLLRP